LKVLEEASPTAEMKTRTLELKEMATRILNEVRALSLQLRPSTLDDLGLLAALRHYFKGYQDRFHLVVDFQVLGLENKRLSPEVETALFRIVQEALINVAMHANAHSVSVLLENRGDSIKLIVEDDGKGFDVAQVMGTQPHERNLGLYGMRERASLLGGSLIIESTPGTGTAVFVVIPLPREEGKNEKDSPADRG
jgi:signal transduction histidine kinase